MKEQPRVKDFMTPAPHTINSGMPLKTAKELMKKYGVRHLPVQVAGHLVGVLTDRDLKLGASFNGAGTLLVDDVMTPEPYAVKPTARFGEVVKTMADRKYGCAIVQDLKGKVVGIFTATDGLRAFGEILNRKQKKPARKKGAKK